MDGENARKAALGRAIDLLGGQSETARKLDVHQSRVNNWLHRDRQGVPAEYCHRIEQLTDGRVQCHELRPDVFPVAA